MEVVGAEMGLAQMVEIVACKVFCILDYHLDFRCSLQAQRFGQAAAEVEAVTGVAVEVAVEVAAGAVVENSSF